MLINIIFNIAKLGTFKMQCGLSLLHINKTVFSNSVWIHILGVCPLTKLDIVIHWPFLDYYSAEHDRLIKSKKQANNLRHN